MILADTSVWIEFLKQKNEEIDQKIESGVNEGSIVALSSVFGELLQGVRDDTEKNVVLNLWTYLPKVDESNILIHAGRLSYESRLLRRGVGLVDATLLVASFIHGLDLWTLDKKLIHAARDLRVKLFA